jgi:hypothetical protein
MKQERADAKVTMEKVAEIHGKNKRAQERPRRFLCTKIVENQSVEHP